MKNFMVLSKETGDVISEIGHCYVCFVACLGVEMAVLNFKWFKHVTSFRETVFFLEISTILFDYLDSKVTILATGPEIATPFIPLFVPF